MEKVITNILKSKRSFFESIIILLLVLVLIIVGLYCYRDKTAESSNSFVLIKGGQFQPGLSELESIDLSKILKIDPKVLSHENNQPVQSITSFYIQKHEVTVGEYLKCVEQGKCKLPQSKKTATYIRPDFNRLPINWVNFIDSQTYCESIGARLPTEYEWEYAARSRGISYYYPWGNQHPSCDLSVIDDQQLGRGCGRRSLWAVCSKPQGNTIQGLCDMAGNAWEWTSSIMSHDCYVMKGGGVGSTKDYRTTLRRCKPSKFAYGGTSFRCAKSV